MKSISAQKKTDFHQLSNFLLAGVHGFEPWKCQIQSLVPYRLAIPQFLGNANILLTIDSFVKRNMSFLRKKDSESLNLPKLSCMILMRNISYL